MKFKTGDIIRAKADRVRFLTNTWIVLNKNDDGYYIVSHPENSYYKKRGYMILDEQFDDTDFEKINL